MKLVDDLFSRCRRFVSIEKKSVGWLDNDDKTSVGNIQTLFTEDARQCVSVCVRVSKDIVREKVCVCERERERERVSESEELL